MSTLWQWQPNWHSPVLERLAWLTGVVSSKDLTEQAIRLRNHPRRSLEFSLLLRGRARRSFEAALFADHAGPWLLPIWPDLVTLDAALPAASGIIAMPAGITTDTRDFQAGGQAMLIQGHQAEAVTIEIVTSSQITLNGATASDYSAGAALYPARSSRMQASQPITRVTGDLLTARCQLHLTDNSAYSAAAPATYRGLPVLTVQPNWREPLSGNFLRQLAQLDYGASHLYQEDTAGRPELVQGHRWFLHGRSAIADYRSWLYALAGRQGAFWLETWAEDLKLVASAASVDTTIDVEHCGYVDRLAGALNRRDIAIRLRDGTVVRRRITGASVVDANTERLQLDSAIGQPVTLADIVRISYLQTARLEADAAEIAWHTGTFAEAAQTIRVVNHDV